MLKLNFHFSHTSNKLGHLSGRAVAVGIVSMNPTAESEAWVITPKEKLKYQEQFKALQPQAGFVTGAQAKGFFLQSQLPPLILGQIW